MSKLKPEAQTLVDIYVLSILLVDKLDELSGTNFFRHKIKHHTKLLTKELEKLDKEICDITQSDFINIAAELSTKVNECLKVEHHKK